MTDKIYDFSMRLFRSLRQGLSSPKVSQEDTARAVARLTIELHRNIKSVYQREAQESTVDFARTALPVDPEAGLLLVKRVLQSNSKLVEEGGEWFTKSAIGEVQGLRSALFNSHLMNIPSEVLFAKYIDRKFLNLLEVAVLDPKSKTYNEESFSSGLSPKRYADFLLSKKIAIVQLELFQSNELLPISLSTLSTSLLIEWIDSEQRNALKL
jgi:hypothetical protein